MNTVPEGHQKNPESIIQASISGDLEVMQARDNETGEDVTLLCAKDTDDSGEVVITPFAQMFGDFNPYVRFTPPS